jgi:hypothetical protein
MSGSAGFHDPTLTPTWLDDLAVLGKHSTAEDRLKLDEMKDKVVPLDQYTTEDGKQGSKYYAPYDFWEKRICSLADRSTIALKVVPSISSERLSYEETVNIQEMIDTVQNAKPPITKIVGMLDVHWFDRGWQGHSVCVVWNKGEATITLHDANPGQLMLLQTLMKHFPTYTVRPLSGHTYEDFKEAADSCVLMSHLSAEIELRNIDVAGPITVDMQKGYATFINPHSKLLATLVSAVREQINETGGKYADKFGRFNFRVSSKPYNARIRDGRFWLDGNIMNFEDDVRHAILNAKAIITDNVPQLSWKFGRGFFEGVKKGFTAGR